MNDQDLFFSVSSWIVDKNSYLIENISFGSGKFGNIYKAIDIMTRNQVVVRKVSPYSGLGSHNKNFAHEIETFVKIQPNEIDEGRGHPAIERFYGFFLLPYQGIITEYFPNGSYQAILSQLESHHEIPYWNHTRKSIFVYGFATGMMHLHAKGIAHRYLKPSNILFDENWEPCISDFYFSRTDTSGMMVSQLESDQTYQAPEVNENHFTKAIDVYSFGLILYSLTVDHKPSFPDIKNPFLFQQAMASGRRPALSSDPSYAFLNTIIERCWEIENKRPTFTEIVSILNKHDDAPIMGSNSQIFKQYKDKVWKKTAIDPDEAYLLEYNSNDWVNNFEKVKAKAESGDPQQWVALGRLYEHGKGVAKDHQQAVFCYKKAAEKNDPYGQYNYAINIFESCPKEAFDLIKKASKNNIPHASYLLARMYQTGYGTKNSIKKTNKSIQIYKKLIEQKVPDVEDDSLCFLGELLVNKGMEENDRNLINEGEKYLNIALKKSNIKNINNSKSNQISDSSNAGVDIAEIEFRRGKIQEGISWLKKAAKQNSPSAFFNLGSIYEKGAYQQQVNPILALKYYYEAIKLGNTRAKTRCGFIFSHGNDFGYPELTNFEYAARFYEDAADEGDKMAQHNFAKMLENGSGVPQNYEQACSYYEAAIQQGTVPSMIALAKILLKGAERVPKDVQRAKQLLEDAASKGNNEAIQILKDNF